jgi:hypothetical protein
MLIIHTMPDASPAIVTRRESLVAALLLAAVAVAALRPSIHGVDGVGNYVALASVLRGGDLDFRDEYALFDSRRDYPFRFADLPVSPATGRPSNRYGVGSAMFWSPFVAAVHLGVRLNAPDRADGATRPYEWAVGIATAFWGSLGLWLLYGWLRRRRGRLACAATVALLIFATPLGFYLYAHGSMSHGISFFLATALLLVFERGWRRPDAAALAGCGALAGLLVITRFQDAPWAALAIGGLIWKVGRGGGVEFRPGRRAGLIVVCLLAALAATIPQLIVWHALYGSFFSGPEPYLDPSADAGHFHPWPRHLPAALVSERGGVLAWHPVYLIGLCGLGVLARRGEPMRAPAIYGLTGFVLLALIVGSWSQWWAGASFGNRFFISALPTVALGLAWLANAAIRRGRRAVVLIVAGLLIVWNLGLLYQYATRMTPREDPIPWSRVIRQNMIDVPRRLLGRGPVAHPENRGDSNLESLNPDMQQSGGEKNRKRENEDDPIHRGVHPP